MCQIIFTDITSSDILLKLMMNLSGAHRNIMKMLQFRSSQKSLGIYGSFRDSMKSMACSELHIKAQGIPAPIDLVIPVSIRKPILLLVKDTVHNKCS